MRLARSGKCLTPDEDGELRKWSDTLALKKWTWMENAARLHDDNLWRH